MRDLYHFFPIETVELGEVYALRVSLVGAFFHLLLLLVSIGPQIIIRALLSILLLCALSNRQMGFFSCFTLCAILSSVYMLLIFRRCHCSICVVFWWSAYSVLVTINIAGNDTVVVRFMLWTVDNAILNFIFSFHFFPSSSVFVTDLSNRTPMSCPNHIE